MLLASDISATFYPSTFDGAKSLGVGQLNIGGIVINFTVYPSNYGQGFYVSLPSRPDIKNGVHEVDEKGRKKYINEVYIAEQAVRPLVDDAVLQAMQNKGVTVDQPKQQAFQAPSARSNPRSFSPPSSSSPNTIKGTSSSGTSVVSGDDLPF